jgi:hypothetical protein
MVGSCSLFKELLLQKRTGRLSSAIENYDLKMEYNA